MGIADAGFATVAGLGFVLPAVVAAGCVAVVGVLFAAGFLAVVEAAGFVAVFAVGVLEPVLLAVLAAGCVAFVAVLFGAVLELELALLTVVFESFGLTGTSDPALLGLLGFLLFKA